MAKVFLTCFSPFNQKERPFPCRSWPPKPSESATLFASLMHDLNVLQKSLEDESISLKWCSEAMFLIKTMHSHILLLLSKRVSQASGSWDRVDLVEDHLKETLDLLDLCNLLRSAISGIDRQRLMADFTVKKPIHGGFPATQVRAFDIQSWKEKSLSKVTRATKSSAVQSAIAAVSLMIYCAVLHPAPIKIGKVFSKLGPHNSFSGCIKRLVRCFLERFQAQAGKQVLSEVEEFQVQLSDESAGMGKGDVSTLLHRSVGLKEGLELLKSVVDEVFDDVIQGRKRLLGLIASESLGLGMDMSVVDELGFGDG